MKKIYIAIISFLCAYVLNAQEMSVKSFYLAETDLTANTPGTMVHDQNGNVCALIKIETTLDGFSFDVGSLGISETKRVGGEIWLYVPFGIRKITLSHPQLGVIRDFALPCAIEKGRTYILKLNASMGNRVYDSSKKQKMILQVTPATATVEINNIPLDHNTSGVYEKIYSLGIYDVTVYNNNYHTQRRNVEISDTANPHNIRIDLKPKFGWLTILGDGDETIYIDGERWYSDTVTLNSGNHQLKVDKPYHLPYESTFIMSDSVKLTITPTFTPIYRELELLVDDNAEIWVNGNKVANGRFKDKFLYDTYKIECHKDRHTQTHMELDVNANTTGPIRLPSPIPNFKDLLIMADNESEVWINNKLVGKGNTKYSFDYGTYEIECRKTGHSPTKVSLPVNANTEGPIQLAAPEPIYGSINVTSNVQDAQLYIDNVYVGNTPYSNKIIVGQHNISLKKKDYPSQDKSVYIADSQIETINFNLTQELPYNVKANVTAAVTVDGDSRGVTPYFGRSTIGKHNLTLKASGYKTLKRTIDLSRPYQEFNYTLQPKKDRTKSRFKLGFEVLAGYDNGELESFVYGAGLNCRYGCFQIAPKLTFGHDSYNEGTVCIFSAPISLNINMLSKHKHDWSPYIGAGYSPTIYYEEIYHYGLVQAGLDFRHLNFNCGFTFDLEDVEYWAFTFGVTYYL